MSVLDYPEWVVLLLGTAAGFFFGLSFNFSATVGAYLATNGFVCLVSAIIVGEYGDRQ